MKKIFLMMMMLATFIFSGCNTQAAINDNSAAVNDDLKISMLNIGHGDAILIRTKQQTILVDSANSKHRNMLVKELEKLSVTKIDKLILTHAHIDHTGNTKVLINPNKKDLEEYPYLEKISVAEVYDNGIAYGSSVYKNYMKAIQTKGIPYKSLKAGDVLDFGNGVKFNVLFPTKDFVEIKNSGQFDKKDRAYNTNNGSIVGKLTYKNFSMMFTGDCEKESEAKIVANNKVEDLKCDVLKAGHHGISTSSKKKFVTAINPSVVVISAANRADEAYISPGRPHLKVLENYLACGINPKNIFCTRFNHTITITSDGKSFSVQPEIEKDWVESWIAGKKEDAKNHKNQSVEADVEEAN